MNYLSRNIKNYIELDISKYHSPLDVIFTQKSIKKMNNDDILKVIFDNPLEQDIYYSHTHRKAHFDQCIIPTEYDLIAFCGHKNLKIIKQEITDKKIVMYIQK